jgi:hypothetical protein
MSCREMGASDMALTVLLPYDSGDAAKMQEFQKKLERTVRFAHCAAASSGRSSLEPAGHTCCRGCN